MSDYLILLFNLIINWYVKNFYYNVRM